MIKLKKYLKLTKGLLVLSIFMMFLSHLALTDIYHGQEDLRAEWTILRLTAIIVLSFILSTGILIKKINEVN